MVADWPVVCLEPALACNGRFRRWGSCFGNKEDSKQLPRRQTTLFATDTVRATLLSTEV
ncbi:hypothetical protein Hsw_1013 [Hymenobacter swuensis DY53]|uniref:Uncharacterized protein n=1 Tax=Hymenobacter swuensis DY53 TaxID=1227739 RepID=W8EVQ6_9BACT|nr:hypothetical protein Hsw_1013 [Hymenobacter swuensis DY53]